MTIGFAIILAGVAGIWIGSALESQLAAALTSDAGMQSAICAALRISTELLGELAAPTCSSDRWLSIAWLAGQCPHLHPGPASHPEVPARHAGRAFAVLAAPDQLVFIRIDHGRSP